MVVGGVGEIIIPLPPTEEQQRIADRVNGLIRKIDEYEKVEKKLADLHTLFFFTVNQLTESVKKN